MNPIIGCASYRRTVDIGNGAVFEMRGISKSYVEAILASGGVPLLIPVGLSEGELSAVLDRVDGLLLPGGGDLNPNYYGDSQRHEKLRGLDDSRDEMDLSLARAAVERKKPLLAICRGHQVLNVALGGTLWQDVHDQMPGGMSHDHDDALPRNHLAHNVAVEEDSLLTRCLGGIEVPVNSLHHQGIRDLAPGLRATAFAPDGLIEGVEVPGRPFAIGVQWHPEELIHDDPAMMALFAGLIQAASAVPQPA